MRSKAVVPVELDTEKPEKLVAGEIRSAPRLWKTQAGTRDSESDWDFIIDFNADTERGGFWRNHSTFQLLGLTFSKIHQIKPHNHSVRVKPL